MHVYICICVYIYADISADLCCTRAPSVEPLCVSQVAYMYVICICIYIGVCVKGGISFLHASGELWMESPEDRESRGYVIPQREGTHKESGMVGARVPLEGSNP